MANERRIVPLSYPNGAVAAAMVVRQHDHSDEDAGLTAVLNDAFFGVTPEYRRRAVARGDAFFAFFS